MSLSKIGRLFNDLYGIRLNDSSIHSYSLKLYDNLEKTGKIITSKLENSPVCYFDETGLRVDGHMSWLHVCSNAVWTHLFHDPKRGKIAMDNTEQSILHSFTGWAVHDGLPVYESYPSKHALCHAHLMRDYKALTEQGVIWVAAFTKYFERLYHLIDKGCSSLSKSQLKEEWATWKELWQYADKLEPHPKKTGKRGRPKSTAGRRLLTRLKKHEKAVLAFIEYDEVPFTNNQAERDLRPAKTKMKVSGCFRTAKGAKYYARIGSFISTARKQGKNIFQEMRNTLQGHNFITHPDTS